MTNVQHLHYRAVFYSLGTLLLVLAAAMLLPMPWAFQPEEEAWQPLLLSALPTTLAGLLLRLRGRGNAELRRRDTYLLVTLAWVSAAVVGALPYLWSGVLPSFTDAFFESMSGFSTTGASVLTDVEAVPRRFSSGARSPTGWGAWGSWCCWSPCSRPWGSVACR